MRNRRFHVRPPVPAELDPEALEACWQVAREDVARGLGPISRRSYSREAQRLRHGLRRAYRAGDPERVAALRRTFRSVPAIFEAAAAYKQGYAAAFRELRGRDLPEEPAAPMRRRWQRAR